MQLVSCRRLLRLLTSFRSVPVCEALLDLDHNLSIYLMILAVLPNQFTLLTDLIFIQIENHIFLVSIETEETPTKFMGTVKTGFASLQSSLKLLDRLE